MPERRHTAQVGIPAQLAKLNECASVTRRCFVPQPHQPIAEAQDDSQVFVARQKVMQLLMRALVQECRMSNEQIRRAQCHRRATFLLLDCEKHRPASFARACAQADTSGGSRCRAKRRF
jgi:hypothetical protein